jgi:hypothetical protein
LITWVERDIDSGCTTAYDVDPIVTCQVGNAAKVLVDAPATSAEAEVVDD